MGTQVITSGLWEETGLDPSAVDRLEFRGPRAVLPSSFAVSEAASALVGAVALAVGELTMLRSGEDSGRVEVDTTHAALAFQSERHLRFEDGAPDLWDPLAGYYEAADGHVQFHTNFDHHRLAMLAALDLPADADRTDVAAATIESTRFEIEDRVVARGGVAAALRTTDEWSDHPHRHRTPPGPLVIRSRAGSPLALGPAALSRPLAGIRVLDLTRIIAGPVASRTLAAYGADVLRVGSDAVPVVEPLLADSTLGKRFCHLDLDRPEARDRALALAADADVAICGYRPGALDRYGLGATDLLDANPHLIVAELSAFGTSGPWGGRRGFDSITQSATGIVLAETEARGADSPTPLPCQLLDHGSGYLLALGVLSGLCHRQGRGGGSHVEVALLGTRDWLVGLGRRDDLDVAGPDAETIEGYCARRDSPWGRTRHMRHPDPMSAVPARWTSGPARGGSSPAEWLPR